MTQVTKTRLLVLTTLALLLAPLLSIEPRTYLTLSVAGLGHLTDSMRGRFGAPNRNDD